MLGAFWVLLAVATHSGVSSDAGGSISARSVIGKLFRLLSNVFPFHAGLGLQATFGLGPKIDSIDSTDLVLQGDAFRDDVPVAKPSGLLVGVIVGTTGRRFFHGPSARHRNTPGSVQRPKIGLGHALADVVPSHQVLADTEIQVILVDLNGHFRFLIRQTRG